MRRLLWKRRERASLYLSHLKCARQLIVTNHIRESGELPRRGYMCVHVCVRACACVCVCARARGRIKVFMRAGAGARFLPSDCSLFRALHARMCTRTRPHPWARAKKMCTRVCVYIALLDCVPGGWIRRSPEIGCCEKKKRKTRSPNFFLQVTTAFIIATKDLESHRIIVDFMWLIVIRYFRDNWRAR